MVMPDGQSQEFRKIMKKIFRYLITSLVLFVAIFAANVQIAQSADHNKPALTDTYSNFLTYMMARITDAVTMMYGSPTNIPANAMRYYRTNNVFQEYIASVWTDKVLGATGGGTGLSTATQGDIIYASAADTFSKLAKNTNATRYLSNTGASNNPAWAQVALATGVSGTLPIANGGTNNTALAATGGIDYSDGTKITGNASYLFYDSSAYAVAIGRGSAGATLDAQQNTAGSFVIKLQTAPVSATDRPTRWVYQADVKTTDATVTTLGSLSVPASTTQMIEATVTARRTGGSAGAAEDGAAYVIRAAAKNVSGTATIIGSVTAGFTAEDQAAWNATIDVSGGAMRVRVTGAANNNITWTVTANMDRIGS